jgi:uncharacterized Ntn-hydrolase superfamily protein
MTFSLIARCPKTEMLGIAIATSAFAVASRCPHVRGGVAAIASQNYSNWKIGMIGLDLAENGLSPDEVIRTLAGYDPHFDYRQFGIVTRDGRVAAHSGSHGHTYNAHLIGDGCAALGNGVVGPEVLEAMLDGFAKNSSETFEEQLMRGIEAGAAAGGEAIGHLSAALIAAEPNELRPRCDLRVDLASATPQEGGDAVHDLRRVFDRYKPLIGFYGDFWHNNPEVTPDEFIRRHS